MGHAQVSMKKRRNVKYANVHRCLKLIVAALSVTYVMLLISFLSNPDPNTSSTGLTVESAVDNAVGVSKELGQGSDVKSEDVFSLEAHTLQHKKKESGAFQPSTTAIVVMTCNRKAYLLQALDALLSLDGVDKYQIIISQDGSDESVMEYAKGMESKYSFIKYINNDMRSNEIEQQHVWHVPFQHISRHYKFVLTTVFERMKGINHAILLEEDLVVSPDFLRLFEQTAPLLDTDASLLCVSSWNDNGYKHMDLDSKRLVRTGFFPGLGWMLRKDLWIDELSEKWPRYTSTGWDNWMRTDEQMKGRECIAPELSRNHNIGKDGTTTKEETFEKKLGLIAFSTDKNTDFGDLSYLHLDQYEANLREQMASAEQLSLESPTGKAGSGSVYKIGYVRDEWQALTKKMGLYISTAPRGHFKYVTVMHRKSNTYLLYDRRRSPLAPESDRLLPPVDLMPIASQQGVNCVKTCAKVGKQCRKELFDYINTCAHLNKAFNMCEPHGCHDENGPDIPCFVSDELHPNYGKCLVTEQTSTCEADHPSTSRLCPCAGRLPPSADLTPTAGKQGVNCVDTCSEIGKRCEKDFFDVINTCDQLKKVFFCISDECYSEMGEDIPVFVSDSSHSNFGKCLVTDVVPTCEAKHPSTSRLCPCVPNEKKSWWALVPRLG